MQQEILAQNLQGMSGELARTLGRLNQMCLSGRWPAGNPVDEVRLLQIACTDADSANRLLNAHGKTSWPGSYGQSPYGEIMAVIRHAVDGQRLPRGSTQVERDLFLMLVPRIAPPATKNRIANDTEEGRSQRYRRLLSVMREVSILSYGEADSALRNLLRVHPTERARTPPSSEAVSHAGGNLRVVQRAYALRHQASRYWRTQEITAPVHPCS